MVKRGYFGGFNGLWFYFCADFDCGFNFGLFYFYHIIVGLFIYLLFILSLFQLENGEGWRLQKIKVF